jgi:hypothetical protein
MEEVVYNAMGATFAMEDVQTRGSTVLVPMSESTCNSAKR